MTTHPRIVLAYSGGLDTSVAISWLRENLDAEVIAVTLDVGQKEDLSAATARARAIGAGSAEVIDAKDEFVQDFIEPAIQANALYEGAYPLSTALTRPLVVEHLVAAAHAWRADAVAHGCTGKGNDQVRFEAGLAALDPELQVIAPLRTWGMNREQEVDYALARNLPTTASKSKIYSIDENLWGRSIEGGGLEDPSVEPVEDVFAWTTSPATTPDEPAYVDIEFEAGVPIDANGEADPVTMIQKLNALGGAHGVGRIDHIEDRVVGIKSREVYECPAAMILLKAHAALEALTLPKDLLRFKAGVEQRFAEVVYDGLWFTPLREALQAFVAQTQARVTGRITVKLYKGTLTLTGRESPYALYDSHLATYGAGDAFDAKAAEGFVQLWSLPSKVWAQTAAAPRLPKAREVISAAASSHGE